MTVYTKIATPPTSRPSASSVQIQMKQNFNSNLQHEIPSNPSLSIWLILGIQLFQWNLSYDQQAPSNYRSLMQKSPIKQTVFCKRALSFQNLQYSERIAGCRQTVYTEIATPLQSTKSKNSDSSVQIQSNPKIEFGFVPRDNEKSEFVDLVDIWEVAF